MVEKIQILLVLLGIIGVLAVVAERVRFPFPVLLVIAGLLIGLFPNLPDAKLDPEVVFLVFLPPLLFSAAWNFPWTDFRSNLLPRLMNRTRRRLAGMRRRGLISEGVCRRIEYDFDMEEQRIRQWLSRVERE